MRISDQSVIAACLSVVLSACSVRALPPDVNRFIDRRETCDHLRGEFPDPPNPQRVQELTESIAASCTGTDAQLARLKERYRNDLAVLRRLDAFETEIERKQP